MGVVGRIKARTECPRRNRAATTCAAEESARSRDQDSQNRNSSAVRAATRSLTSAICRIETGGSAPDSTAS